MSKITIYSKYPIPVQFFNPSNNHTFILEGMNSHAVEVPAGTPKANQVDAEDWQWLKETYGTRKSWFDPINGDMFYEAKNEKDAKLKMADSKPVIDDIHLVSKQKNVQNYKEDKLG